MRCMVSVGRCWLFCLLLIFMVGAARSTGRLIAQTNGTIPSEHLYFVPYVAGAYPPVPPQDAVRIGWTRVLPVRHGTMTSSLVRIQLRNDTVHTAETADPVCWAGTLKLRYVADVNAVLAEFPVIFDSCVMYAGSRLYADIPFAVEELPVGDYAIEVVFESTDEVPQTIDAATATLQIVPETDSAVRLQTGVDAQLLALSFVDAATGWVVGEDQTILHTEDAGDTWSAQRTGPGWLSAVQFVDYEHGWAVGNDGDDHGIVLMTTDGGSNWVSSELESAKHLYEVAFVNATTGWTLGYDAEASYHIWRTDDGGMTWNSTPIGIWIPVFSESLVNRTHAWLLWWGTRLLVTTDAGHHWTRLPIPESVDHATSVEFVSPEVGWICGQQHPDDGALAVDESIDLIVQTDDGGKHWLVRAILRQEGFDRIKMLDTENGVFFSADYVMLTTDGGRSWSQWLDAPTPVLAVQMVEPDTVYWIESGGVIARYTGHD